jgi:hypothetical protein
MKPIKASTITTGIGPPEENEVATMNAMETPIMEVTIATQVAGFIFKMPAL